jgi:hypothetical protein
MPNATPFAFSSRAYRSVGLHVSIWLTTVYYARAPRLFVDLDLAHGDGWQTPIPPRGFLLALAGVRCFGSFTPHRAPDWPQRRCLGTKENTSREPMHIHMRDHSRLTDSA